MKKFFMGLLMVVLLSTSISALAYYCGPGHRCVHHPYRCSPGHVCRR